MHFLHRLRPTEKPIKPILQSGCHYFRWLSGQIFARRALPAVGHVRLKSHLLHGFSLNRQRLAERGVEEAQAALDLLARTLTNNALVAETGQAVVSLISGYARTWRLCNTTRTALHYPQAAGQRRVFWIMIEPWWPLPV